MSADWCYYNILLCGHWAYWGLKVLWHLSSCIQPNRSKSKSTSISACRLFWMVTICAIVCESDGVISSCTSTGRWLKLIDFRNTIHLNIEFGDRWTVVVAVGDVSIVVRDACKTMHILGFRSSLFRFDMKVTKAIAWHWLRYTAYSSTKVICIVTSTRPSAARTYTMQNALQCMHVRLCEWCMCKCACDSISPA